MEATNARINRQAATVVVHLRGPLLLHSAPMVREQLSRYVDDHPPLLVADLRQVPEIDSSGLALLLWMQRSQVNRGCQFIVVSDNIMLTRAFEVTGLDEVLDIHGEMPDLDD